LHSGAQAVARDLHQADRGIETTHGPQCEVRGVDDDEALRSDQGGAVPTLEGAGAQAADRDTLADHLAWRVAPSERGKHHGRVHTQGGGHDGVEGGRGGVGSPLQLEQRRHRGPSVGRQSVPPPELVESVIKGLAGVALDRLPDTRLEELELLALH
jgi:hypothetical protein